MHLRIAYKPCPQCYTTSNSVMGMKYPTKDVDFYSGLLHTLHVFCHVNSPTRNPGFSVSLFMINAQSKQYLVSVCVCHSQPWFMRLSTCIASFPDLPRFSLLFRFHVLLLSVNWGTKTGESWETRLLHVRMLCQLCLFSLGELHLYDQHLMCQTNHLW